MDNKTFIIISTIWSWILCGIILIVVFLIKNANIKKKIERCTSVIDGRVVSVNNAERTIEYTLHGETKYETITVSQMMALKIDSHVNIHYNPDNLNDHYVEGYEDSFDIVWLLVLSIIAIVAACLLLLYMSYNREYWGALQHVLL